MKRILVLCLADFSFQVFAIDLKNTVAVDGEATADYVCKEPKNPDEDPLKLKLTIEYMDGNLALFQVEYIETSWIHHFVTDGNTHTIRYRPFRRYRARIIDNGTVEIITNYEGPVSRSVHSKPTIETSIQLHLFQENGNLTTYYGSVSSPENKNSWADYQSLLDAICGPKWNCKID